jgi:Mg2+/citrate symporter
MLLQPILILIIFLFFAGLMMTQRISTLLALVLMAIFIALVAGVQLLGTDGILEDVIALGAVRLAPAYAAVIFGAWLGQVMLQTGISQDLIRRAAELAGDRPMAVAIAVGGVVALLFTTLAGLGSVIMIGTIVLPIMLSVGIKPVKAATIFLFAIATGFAMNLANWQLFASLGEIDLAIIRQFGVIQFALTAVVALIFIVFQMRQRVVAWAVAHDTKEDDVLDVSKKVPIYSLLTPFIPLVLVLFFNWNIIPAFLAGIFYGAVSVNWRESFRIMTKAALDGLSAAAPAIMLMVAIGMVLRAVFHPAVAAVMQPFLTTVFPSSTIGFILFFAILAPLALYRGPMNLFGLGAGIAGLVIGGGILPAPAAITGFMATERMQSVGDPTNTHNVWTADFAGVDVNAISIKLVPFLWVVAAISAVLAGIIHL